ncbi:MAG: type II toxin-antitoxin system PemK/MazF family toxin, partial [Limnochordia bacterium]
LRTIDKRRLKEKIAHLDDEIMSEIDRALMISLGLVDL